MKDILFYFHPVDSPPANNQGIYLVRIPIGISDKKALLSLIASLLRFPNYFGSNWDALDECLTDLSWLQIPIVCILHEDIPLISNPDEARRYLQVLDGALREPGNIPLQISFPNATKKNIQTLLN